MNPAIHNQIIRKFKNGSWIAAEDRVAVEEPLEIVLVHHTEGRMVSQNISITMRTPGADEALALGFLFTEGIVRSPEEVTQCSRVDENRISVQLSEHSQPAIQKLERHFYTTSSCGVCGKSSLEAVRTLLPSHQIGEAWSIDAETILSLNEKLRERQSVFDSTGGLHASALYDRRGNCILLQEDVGRHNALDKLIGIALSEKLLPLREHILLLSGRASFELIQKSAMAGISMVCALGAPSSLAISLAIECNMGLIGFIKKDSFNVYNGFDRII